MTQEQTQKNLAVLIDADNAQASIVPGLFVEIAKYGTASVKRIYGDWTNPNLKTWKDILIEYAIQPIQQFGYTKGKNATDSAMIIDAMDLLYTEKLGGFCIVSSDSDFTRLASRIREEGLIVIGFGESKTPQSFVSSCDKFVYTEILRKDTTSPATTKIGTRKLKGDTKLVQILRNAVNNSTDESGWAYLGTVGQYISKTAPDFDPRTYGYTKLVDLMKATQLFSIDERTTGDSPAKLIYVMNKRNKLTSST